MTEPTDLDLRRLAHVLTEVDHFGAVLNPEPSPCRTFPPWRLRQARAMWSLGARVDEGCDGLGELHGPVRSLGAVRR